MDKDGALELKLALTTKGKFCGLSAKEVHTMAGLTFIERTWGITCSLGTGISRFVIFVSSLRKLKT